MRSSRGSKSHSSHKSHHLTASQNNESTNRSESVNQSASPNQNKRRTSHNVKKKHKPTSSHRSEVRPKPGIIDRLKLFISSTMNNFSNSIASINQTITSNITRPHEFEPDVPIFLLGEQFKHPEPYHLVNKSATDSPRISDVVENSPNDLISHTKDDRVVRSNSLPDNNSAPTLSSMLESWHSMIWLTYRTGFQPIQPSLTSDAGWGCMIRTTQMMLAAALSRMWLGRQFRLTTKLTDGQASSFVDVSALPPLYLTLLSFFIDSPDAPFSLHAMLTGDTTAELNQTSGQPRAGEWFGPTATCHMIARCVNRLQSSDDRRFGEVVLPRVYITDDQTVYLDEIQNASTQLSSQSDFQPLLVLVPSRLGADRVNSSYQSPLLRTFSCPSSLGVLGGKPRTSLYFAGCQGPRLLYLDPHTVNQSVESKESLNDAAVRETFHSSIVRSLPFEQLDPSLALGFVISTQDEFDRWLVDLQQMEKEFGAYALVHVRDTRASLMSDAPDVLTEDDDDDFVVL